MKPRTSFLYPLPCTIVNMYEKKQQKITTHNNKLKSENC